MWGDRPLEMIYIISPSWTFKAWIWVDRPYWGDRPLEMT
jgi:hypothetical protein